VRFPTERPEEEPIVLLKPQPVRGVGHRTAFTLVELLVVVGIISALMAISLPAMNLVRQKALQLKGRASLKTIAAQLGVFANDHEDRYPPSVATVGSSEYWTWYDPRRLVAVNAPTGLTHRSMSAYLHEYIERGEAISCPSVPFDCKYMREVWNAGDDWDNPAIPGSNDPMTGSLCFYWNYQGLLDVKTKRVFRGPWGPAGGRSYSGLLVSDYFGYGNGLDIPPSYAYSSCEPFDGAVMGDKSDVSRWVSKAPGSGKVPPDAQEAPQIKLKAAFVDGHVEQYSSSEVVPMWVIKFPDSLVPYDINGGQDTPGLFFLPKQAVPH
jgi:prepilin-type N-terminal cleavage/methylation domain-containing protein